MTKLANVSQTLAEMLKSLQDNRDNEVSMADEVLGQYITDHNDAAAWREKDRQVNQLARAFDRMIVKLEKWQAEAEKIEASCDNFYGD
jgi:hypothetical protein